MHQLLWGSESLRLQPGQWRAQKRLRSVSVSLLLVLLVGLNSGKQKSVLRETILAPANLIGGLRDVKCHGTWK